MVKTSEIKSGPAKGNGGGTTGTALGANFQRYYTTPNAPLSSPLAVYDACAATVIRALLNGEPPNGVNPADYGRWAESVGELVNAYQQGGTEAVRRAFSALANDNPALIALVAGGERPRKTLWTAAELLTVEFPEPRWAVPGLIPSGLSFLAGRPKVGKSWLALQIAHAVGTGGIVFGQRVEQGKVLYLALEDSPRRLQERLKKQGVPATAQIVFATDWDSFVEGGMVSLQKAVEQEGYRLVVVDTFARALGRADQQDITEMTIILGNLQKMASVYDIAILLIDHHRKNSGYQPNPVDDILGSTAKSAVADASLGLFREQGAHNTTLKIVGRDIEEKMLALEWDAILWCWQLLGEAGEVMRDTLKGDILQAIRELTEMGELPTVTSIAHHLDKDKGNVSRALADLVGTGKVMKGPRQGKQQPYYLPGDVEQQ